MSVCTYGPSTEKHHSRYCTEILITEGHHHHKDHQNLKIKKISMLHKML